MSVSTGIGWDSHRLAEGRPLILGGVTVEHDRGLDGHSDADVLTHAVIDALLGAAGLGDIGEHFPDTDQAYAGADSISLLRDVVALLGNREVLHVDTTLLMERPKLKPYKDTIRETLAGALGVTVDRVNIKASTGEGIGFVGREEGVAALAVATLSRP
ncbi:MAG: 2-C-methyl-D-erythritol 2,4-cyclodiphosphate synthase [uncultured Solirubrobacteraceae bacterium]|uniref:2-C-methyl-D-erythritol 2,4-cyclodiphosphate synthase n=1 Tax=uncultured Solirubrobacteraceae bacterium TaxID=1162706 RepID=A0A6J4TMX5_9ACTN|nr:MAG: 2-C-methyl-D-erythritol 2,4-cyclodiphosphate synthase [uncultured Solirubrobacteraceae bacterium]